MVLVQFKKSQKNNFTLQFKGQTLIEEVLANIVEINNIRIYLDRLIWSIDELANKGILKPPELQAVSYEDYQKNPQQFADLTPEKKEFGVKPKVQFPFKYVPDKHNHRQGVLLPDEQNKILLDAIAFSKKVMESKKQIIEKKEILSAIEQLRQAVMIAYPAYIGLPDWEPSLLILEEKLDLEILQSQNFELYDADSTIWWAGKQLDKKKTLSQYAGGNQKTKIVVKVQKKGGQKPAREPPVDAQTYKQMVKYYYKKVQQNKEFQKKSVQTHYQDIKSQPMKQKVHLATDIKYKPYS